ECGDEQHVAAGQLLIERGHSVTGLFLILEGTVVVEAPEGTRELGAGTVIGERALFAEDGRRTARVRASSDLRVVCVDRIHVERLCDDDAAFAGRLANATATDLA